jgi:hypothetical protein
LKQLRDKFDELTELLLTHRDSLAQGTGVPFVRLLYHPDEELEVRELTKRLTQKVEKAGYLLVEIRCSEYPFKYYQKKKQLELRLKTAEEHPAEAANEMGRHAEEDLLAEIIRQAESATDKTVLLLTETGLLYPFAQLSGILLGCENKVHIPLVFCSWGNASLVITEHVTSLKTILLLRSLQCRSTMFFN